MPLNIDITQILLHMLNFVILAGGLTFLLYRPVQKFLNEGYTRLDAEKAAAEISAAPGTSEHQTGLGVDIIDKYTETLSGFSLDPAFEEWLHEHCVEYGFIWRYPESKIGITGRYEPWHVRYVGKIAANFMKVHDLCLEEFVNLY